MGGTCFVKILLFFEVFFYSECILWARNGYNRKLSVFPGLKNLATIIITCKETLKFY